ncbi:MAG: type II toxin-antitoxin system VapC family toxin [Chloroflexota bacterium]
MVLDASAVVALLIDDEPHASRVAAYLVREDGWAQAPHLLELEVAQVLRRYVRHGEMSLSQAAASFEGLGDLRLVRYAHTELLPRIWDLRENLTAYDATYIALAEALDAVLLTTDERLGRAPGYHARVEVV